MVNFGQILHDILFALLFTLIKVFVLISLVHINISIFVTVSLMNFFVRKSSPQKEISHACYIFDHR